VFAVVFTYYWLFIRNEHLGQTLTLNDIALEYMYTNCSMLMFIYFYVLVNYISSCLYDDRKTKQILFWRSMPVSETMNVLTKVFLVVVLVPTFFLVINEAFIILASIVGSIYLIMLDDSARIVFSPIDNGNAFVVPWIIYRDNLFGMVFILPMIGYLLLVSAWVKRFPVAIAFGIPMFLTFIDYLLGQLDLTIGVMSLVKRYGAILFEIKSTFVLREVFEFQLQFWMPWLISVFIGALFIVISIWLRNNRYEI